jgi:L-aspartate oxidase
LQRHDVDVLVVGAGLAGLATALSAEGRHVTLLCPQLPPAATASALAQGGIAAAVGNGDSAVLHAVDTFRAGAGECDARAVVRLCTEAVSAILWLEAQGVRFDRRAGSWAVHREAAHGCARVLHIGGDRTGAALTAMLASVVHTRPNVGFLLDYTAVALTRAGDRVTGVVALDGALRPLWIEACDTVLATGGLGQLYCHTTNPHSACGDGLAMALAAGARCMGLEFVQFHPTALDVASDPLPLMTEALRGAGALLIDARGTRFMSRAHPAAELAARDVLAREVWKQMDGGAHVYLDATEVFRRDPASFPAVRALCAAHRIDPLRDPIPIVPAAHFHMGGVAVDIEGRASLAHLWACGEVACTGVHGANRLASNSLLEAVVFGRKLGHALTLARDTSAHTPRAAPECLIEGAALEVDARAWDTLRRTMWTHLGIVRDATGMQAGLAAVDRISQDTLGGPILFKGRLQLARAMIAAALARKESRGAHFRADSAAPAVRADPNHGLQAHIHR